RFYGNNPPLASEFSLLFNSADIEPQHNRDIAALTVRLHSENIAATDSSTAPIIDWRNLKISQTDDHYLFEYQQWQLRLNIERAEFDIWGSAPAESERLFFREFFLRAALLFFLRRNRYFELHGGACVNPTTIGEPHGYLLLGRSS